MIIIFNINVIIINKFLAIVIGEKHIVFIIYFIIFIIF
jgi:hypothetical protein